MVQKYILVAIAMVAYANGTLLALHSGKRNIVMGEDNPGDAILLQLDVHHPLYIAKHTTKVVYPPEGFSREEIIKYIDIKDKIVTGKGATVEILNGGVGYKYVTIGITSQLAAPVNTRIILKGAKKREMRIQRLPMPPTTIYKVRNFKAARVHQEDERK